MPRPKGRSTPVGACRQRGDGAFDPQPRLGTAGCGFADAASHAAGSPLSLGIRRAVLALRITMRSLVAAPA
jgi:hypothetical protein